MEIFTIDGIKVILARKNRAMLVYLGPEERLLTSDKIRYYSAFRLRRRTVANRIFLNVIRRKRMLELMSSGMLTGMIIN